jgi:hypothetical protein
MWCCISSADAASKRCEFMVGNNATNALAGAGLSQVVAYAGMACGMFGASNRVESVAVLQGVEYLTTAE